MQKGILHLLMRLLLLRKAKINLKIIDVRDYHDISNTIDEINRSCSHLAAIAQLTGQIKIHFQLLIIV